MPVQVTDGDVGLIIPEVGFAAPSRQTDNPHAKLSVRRTTANVHRFLFTKYYSVGRTLAVPFLGPIRSRMISIAYRQMRYVSLGAISAPRRYTACEKRVLTVLLR